MTKYKLEYIWLDGKKPIPELARQDSAQGSLRSHPLSPICPFGDSTAAPPCRPRAAESDCILKPVALYPDAKPQGRLHRSERSDAPRWHAALDQYARHNRGRSRPVGWLRAGILPLQRRPSARDSRKRAIPAPQGPYYCGVGYKYMGRMARTIVEEHLELCLYCRHQSRRHQRRGGQGPVGVPDLRQGIAQGR